jgi:molybdopterin-containing oxidoreductase family iron-sulfur binding subunit
MTNEASMLNKYASEAFAGLVSPVLEGVQISAAPAVDLTKEDTLVRMTAELKRAMAKPASERHWVMVIDLRKCVGCNACTVACIAENKLPPGVVYRPVTVQEVGTYPNVTMNFLPRPCMHCDNPPCTEACPVTATYKNEEGIVVVDYDQCIGCRSCIGACPYGARTFDFGQTYSQSTPDGFDSILGQSNADNYEMLANVEYGQNRVRKARVSPIGNVRKCHFCLHRIKDGMLPACTTTCIGRATYFGDANDPTSLVAELINKPNAIQLKEELGTEPRVYYIV